MINSPSHIFNRCGFASLSDVRTQQWRELFELLETMQAEFLARQDSFRSKEYKWPIDPLHTWSRIWEYPYTYHHLKKRRQNFTDAELPCVVDVGSGVTFFPFALARLGYKVICTDIDAVCNVDIGKAKKCISYEPGQIEFRLTDGVSLPFDDSHIDCVYCISVLEHIPTPAQTVKEIARILKPGGLFILTIDVDPDGITEIGPVNYQILTHALNEYFASLYPPRIVHPTDLLSASSSPLPMKKLSAYRTLRWAAENYFKRLKGKKLSPPPSYNLLVEGFVMTKK